MELLSSYAVNRLYLQSYWRQLGRSNLTCRYKISDPVQNIFLRGGWGTATQLKFFQTSEIVRKRVGLESSYSGCRLI